MLFQSSVQSKEEKILSVDELPHRWNTTLNILTYQQFSNPEIDFAGKTCPLPGSLPHGNWTCEMQEIPIHGTSLLDEDAQSYPGKLNSGTFNPNS